MYAYMKEVHKGAGFKLARSGVNGTVSIRELATSKDYGTFGFMNSEFYKVLPVGQYEFKIDERNGQSRTISVRVEADAIRPNGNFSSLR